MNDRYSGIAIALHWAIAFLIIGMLALGKYMTNLAENDPERFILTQWHKSFGICILILSLFRLIWRLTHKPPASDKTIPLWQRRAASATHFLFYVLILAIPLTGWIMVSASPLNIPTLLFQFIPWAHLPYIGNRADIADLFHFIHMISANLLLLLLLLHVGAALQHQFIIKDRIMSRMSPLLPSGRLISGFGAFTATALVVVSLLLVTAGLRSNGSSPSSAISVETDSQVSFIVPLMGMDLQGSFQESDVVFTLDRNNMANSSLKATVKTELLDTTEVQVTNSLPGLDWFDSGNFPVATFTSDSIALEDNPDTLVVNGNLQIKDITKPISFNLELTDTDDSQQAAGGFTINRLDFNIGTAEQPDDSTVGLNVLIEFKFKTE